MVTRLRSDKGSFVQSPKKAFDTESALSGIVFNKQYQLRSDVRTYSPACNIAFPSILPDQEPLTTTVFLLQSGSWPVWPTLAGLWIVGNTSGATFSLGQAEYGMSLQCVTPSNQDVLFGGQQELFGADIASEYVATVTSTQIGFFTQWYVTKNQGGDGFHPAGFIQNETFSVVTSEPAHQWHHIAWPLSTIGTVQDCVAGAIPNLPTMRNNAGTFVLDKAKFSPPWPQDGLMNWHKATQITEYVEPNEARFNTSAAPFTATPPACLDELPPNYWFAGVDAGTFGPVATWEWQNYSRFGPALVGCFGYKLVSEPP